MSRILRTLQGNVLGLLAITIALSAGAYAVDKAPKDSVVSSSIKNGSVKGVDVRHDSLTGKEVEESTLVLPAGSVGTAQVADGSLVGTDLGRAVEDLSLPSGSTASGTCLSPSIFVTNGPGQVGDFVLTSTVPAIPPGWLVSARVGPAVSGTAFRQYFVSVCNFTGAAASVPVATLKMLVISQ